jgi:hypothetical protein
MPTVDISARRLRDSGLSPRGRQLGEILIIVFSVTVSYAAVARPASATMAPPRRGRLAIGGRSSTRGRQALCTYATQGRRVRRSWRTVIEVPRRPTSERDWPHMPYMPKARCVLLGAAACSYLKNSAAPTTCLLRLASALPYGCRAE